MEFKHFSHNHGLIFHQLAEGSEVHCSGCQSPCSGNVYVCWQCSHFLHERCFRAARSLKHPSHPLHPLTLVPFPTHPSGTFFCDTCTLVGNGFSYSCSDCDFDLHVHCAHIPNAHTPYPPTQNPIYPPPIHNNAFPTYPPHNPTIPNNGQTYPPPPQPQTTTGYPPIPNNPLYPNPNIPNQTQHYAIPQTNTYPPNPNNPNPAFHQPNPNNPNPAFHQPNPNSTNAPNPSPQPLNNPVTTNPQPTTPPVTQPVNNPQQKPPTIIKHFSHPHVMKAMEVDPKNAKVCSACECELSGPAYCCTEPNCTFNLHKTCFDSPQELRHKSHLEHPLKLLPAPSYNDGFTCNACLKDGKAFVYNCAICTYDLHIDCVQWPEAVHRPDHQHDLTLYYSSPAANASEDVVFICDVCKNPVHELAWVYHCRECDFGTHLECVASGIKAGEGGSSTSTEAKTAEELAREAELKFAVLQLLLGAQGLTLQ